MEEEDRSPRAPQEDVIRGEVSPLLSKSGRKSAGSRKAAAKSGTRQSRRSAPLEYTEFRSPQASNQAQTHDASISKAYPSGGDGVNESQGSDQVPLSRNSPLTNLETLSSVTIWIILFLPISICCLLYGLTYGWKYYTVDIAAASIMQPLPFRVGRLSFLRPTVIVDQYPIASMERNAYSIVLKADLIEHVAGIHHQHLVKADVSVTKFYHRFLIDRAANYTENAAMTIPLHMVYLDYPLLARTEQHRRLWASLNVSMPETSVVSLDTSNATSAGLATATVAPPVSISAEWTTHSPSYSTFVSALQLVLALFSAVLAFITARAAYTTANRLRERFVTLEGRSTSQHPYYGAIDSVELVHTEAYTVRWWQFVLPEQMTVVFLLTFLCVWQGPLPSFCALLVDLGVSVHDGWLFTSGLTVTLAQFGVIFCWTVYVDGLKHHSSASHAGAKWRHLLRRDKARDSTGSVRLSYDPFEAQESRRLSAPADTDREYWRRGSLGLRGYSSRLASHPEEALSPLEREYKQSTALFITEHHPSHPEFLGFIHGKLILLIISWLVAFVYWLLAYPRLWHRRPLNAVQISNVNWRFGILEVLMSILGVAWACLFVQACISTGTRLRRMKLIDSRFRQVAFRSLMIQMYLGAILLALIGLWYIHTEELFAGTHFTSLAAASEYAWLWCAHYGVFSVNAVLMPPLAVHNLEGLVFLSTVVYCAAYAMVPPETRSPALAKRLAQSFVTLHRLLPSPAATAAAALTAKERERRVTAMRQYVVNEEYRKFMGQYLPLALAPMPATNFCLESALQCLEVSYQTYFSVLAKPSGLGAAKKKQPVEHHKKAPNPFDEDVAVDEAPLSSNPFDSPDDEDEVVPAVNGEGAAAGPSDSSQYGPKINLAGLGYRLLRTFSCDKYTTFGFVCEGQEEGKLVVSFRGSVAGNAVSNLKFTQVALPSLKRSRAYFTALLREGGNGQAGHGDEGEDGLLTPSNELIPDADPQHAVIEEDEFAGLYDRVDSADAYEEELNFLPPAVEPSLALKDSKLARKLKQVGTAIPLVNQGFKRVHAGFWDSYASIRDEYMAAVVSALHEKWKRRISTVQASSSVSPANSWYVNAAAGTTPTKDQTAVGAALDGARALFASPFSLQNPFTSPAAEAAQSSRRSAVGPSPRTPASGDHNGAVDASALSVVFCGHSLGAAIASLAAFELAENLGSIMEAFAMEECFNVPKVHATAKIPAVLFCPAPQLSLYMFGSPRVGNPTFALSIEKKIPDIFCIQVNGDVVTMMPKFVGFYRHFGTAVIVDEGETGSLIIEPTLIERSLLQKSTGSVANHSLDKYRTCLEACFEPAELEEYLTKEFRGLTASGVAKEELPEWITGSGLV